MHLRIPEILGVKVDRRLDLVQSETVMSLLSFMNESMSCMELLGGACRQEPRESPSQFWVQIPDSKLCPLGALHPYHSPAWGKKGEANSVGLTSEQPALQPTRPDEGSLPA